MVVNLCRAFSMLIENDCSEAREGKPQEVDEGR